MGELRWILLGAGALAIGAIWWWSTRRSGQAPGNAELRESTVVPAHTLAPAPSIDAPPPEKRSAPGESRDWGVPPLEPLSIRTADFDSVTDFDQPMMIQVDSMDETFDLGAASQELRAQIEIEHPEPVLSPAPPAPAPQMPLQPPPILEPPPKMRPSTESSDRTGAAAPQAPNASEKQKIVTLRVCAVGDARWAGAQLMSTLEGHGLAFGRYQVYHRKLNDGRSVFCVASLIEPGTFDISSMATDEFRGVSMFAVLPGPLDPLQTVDALLATARDLARELSGTVQDGRGMPFSPQRVTALREDVARFQAQLT